MAIILKMIKSLSNFSTLWSLYTIGGSQHARDQLMEPLLYIYYIYLNSHFTTA